MQSEKDELHNENPQAQEKKYFEKDPIGMRAGIRIKNLRKVCYSAIGLLYVQSGSVFRVVTKKK